MTLDRKQTDHPLFRIHDATQDVIGRLTERRIRSNRSNRAATAETDLDRAKEANRTIVGDVSAIRGRLTHVLRTITGKKARRDTRVRLLSLDADFRLDTVTIPDVLALEIETGNADDRTSRLGRNLRAQGHVLAQRMTRKPRSTDPVRNDDVRHRAVVVLPTRLTSCSGPVAAVLENVPTAHWIGALRVRVGTGRADVSKVGLMIVVPGGRVAALTAGKRRIAVVHVVVIAQRLSVGGLVDVVIGNARSARAEATLGIRCIDLGIGVDPKTSTVVGRPRAERARTETGQTDTVVGGVSTRAGERAVAVRTVTNNGESTVIVVQIQGIRLSLTGTRNRIRAGGNTRRTARLDGIKSIATETASTAMNGTTLGQRSTIERLVRRNGRQLSTIIKLEISILTSQYAEI